MSAFWSDRRILVTGGGGFLGYAILRGLERRGADDVVSPARRDYDLTDEEAVGELLSARGPFDLVLHLAAEVGGIGMNQRRPADLYLSNLLMGTYVIERARREEVPKVVLLGTICAYPKYTSVPFKEESLWDGYPEETNAPYGIAKKALLVQAQANRLQYGQNAIFLLPTNLYGPFDKFDPEVSHVIPALIKKCIDARERDDPTIEVWGSGQATREFLYVDDAAEGILLAAEHYDEPDPVNLGSGEEIAIRDLAELIAKLTGFEGDLTWDTSQPDGQPRRRVDASRAAGAFGFSPTISLEEGLRRTIEWYLTHREAAEPGAGAPAR